jgi:hypothetical protein
MTILSSITQWPADILVTINRAKSDFFYTTGIEPTHLFVGEDCRRRFKDLMARVSVYSYDIPGPTTLYDLYVIWSNDPGIRLFYSPEKIEGPLPASPTPTTAADRAPSAR